MIQTASLTTKTPTALVAHGSSVHELLHRPAGFCNSAFFGVPSAMSGRFLQLCFLRRLMGYVKQVFATLLSSEAHRLSCHEMSEAREMHS